MAVPWQVMNKIRSEVREVVGRDIYRRREWLRHPNQAYLS